MFNLRPTTCMLPFIVLILCDVIQAQENGLTKHLSAMAREAAVKLLHKKSFDFASDTTRGKLTAIEPDKSVRIDFQKLELKADTVHALVDASGRFRVETVLASSGKEVSVDADTTLRLHVAMEARLVKRDGSFYVQPSVKGFDFQIEIHTVKPESLTEGKQWLEQLLNGLVATNKQFILQAINATLTEQKLPTQKLLTRPLSAAVR
ncbi:hypothetical protein SH501x_003190 [Pirellulaceae bacterium SH501]